MAVATGHIGGFPVEELLVPFLVTGGPMFLLAARMAFARVWRRGDTKGT